ncbi:MAG: DUF6364 family protein [Verrucomicrobiota bacterium]
MQTKLTLRMESDLIEEAKKVAEDRNVSLSQMVADFFNAITTKDASEDFVDLPPKTRSLHGALRSNKQINEREDYRDFVEEKYS